MRAAAKHKKEEEDEKNRCQRFLCDDPFFLPICGSIFLSLFWAILLLSWESIRMWHWNQILLIHSDLWLKHNIWWSFVSLYPSSYYQTKNVDFVPFHNAIPNFYCSTLLFNLLIYLMLRCSILSLKKRQPCENRINKIKNRYLSLVWNAHSIPHPFFLRALFRQYKYNLITITLSACFEPFLTKICDFYSVIFMFGVSIKCMNTQLRRRCDAAVIDDNTQCNSNHVLDTAVAANSPSKEHDRRPKKSAEKCRTKTGMCVCVCFAIVVDRERERPV